MSNVAALQGKPLVEAAVPVNTSGLHPQGRGVLVQAYDTLAQRSSVIAIPETVKQQMAILENVVRIVELGASVWHDEPRPRAKVGDLCLVTRLAGFIRQGRDGKLYRIVNDRDIFCTMDEEEDHATS